MITRGRQDSFSDSSKHVAGMFAHFPSRPVVLQHAKSKLATEMVTVLLAL